MTHTVDGAVITPDIISALKDFQCGSCDWLLKSLDNSTELMLDNRDQYDAKELLEIMAAFQMLKTYINDFKAGGKHE